MRAAWIALLALGCAEEPRGYEVQASGTSADLMAVHFTAQDDGWAVGAAGTILHWNGTDWSSVASGVSATLLDVWASGADDAWAVGEYGAMVRWSGSAWEPYTGIESDIVSIWGSGANDVWAVVDDYDASLLHWNGSEWSWVDYGYDNYFPPDSAWGTGPDDVWLLSESWEALVHWDGSAWNSILLPLSEFFPAGMWGTSSSDIWLVGYGGAAHWDGSIWTPVDMDGGSAIGGSGTDDVWTIGNGIDDYWDGSPIQHWNGSSWASHSDTTLHLNDVGGAGDDIWAVGEYGAIARMVR